MRAQLPARALGDSFEPMTSTPSGSTPRDGQPFVLAPVRAQFRALAAVIAPECASMTDAEWVEAESIIDHALAARPESIKRQLRLFIRVLHALPLVRYGKSFAALSASDRERLLASVEGAPALALRRGFWGLRTLVYMGCYARPSAAAALGYRPSARGWLDRRASTGRAT